MTRKTQDQTQVLQSSPSRLWTVEQVATYLNLAPETIRTMARNGIIPAMKAGKRLWRFHASDIQAWLRDKKEYTHA